MKSPSYFLTAWLVLAIASCSSTSIVIDNLASDDPKPENIILFISDGSGPASFTMARDFLRAQNIRQQLYLDAILTGSLETWSASNSITGSGPSATSLGSGVKSNNLALGMDADNQPVPSILAKAEAAGLNTGVIVTREVYDATPGSFTAHVTNRYEFRDEIVNQQLDSGVDLLIGGGLDRFTPIEDGGLREDGRNMLAVGQQKGYSVATSRSGWDAIESLPALVLLAEKQLDFEIDRVPTNAPSLAEMTSRALQLLEESGKPFFLLVEGSTIDLGGHDNDAAAHVRDIIAYDEAVKVALDFAANNQKTLVVSTSDHETGGLSVGRSYTWHPSVIAGIRSSHNVVVEQIKNRPQDIRGVVAEYMGIVDLSDEELALIATATTRNQYNQVLGEIVGDRAFINWASLSHTAVDVNLYAFGPGSDTFIGHFDNTYVGQQLPILLGLE